jgi:hypothetical protein
VANLAWFCAATLGHAAAPALLAAMDPDHSHSAANPMNNSSTKLFNKFIEIPMHEDSGDIYTRRHE